MAALSLAGQVRARAAQVRQDGAYCGLFESLVLASLRNLTVLLVFGTSVIDVYKFCAEGLPRTTGKDVWRFVAVRTTSSGIMLSADNPGTLAPDANHFMIGRSSFDKRARDTSDDAIVKYLPTGERRKAADAAGELNMRLLKTVQEIVS